MAMNNSTFEPTPLAACQLYIQHIILLVFYTFVTIVGVFGNISIIYVFHYRIRRSKNVTECLITYLAMFDLLSSIFGPFTFLYWILTCSQQWHFGFVGCKTLPTLSRIFINISVGIIILLAIDRHRLICTPFKEQMKVRHGHIGVAVSICLSVIVEIYYVHALRIHKGRCLVIPHNKQMYGIVSSSLLIVRDGFLVLAFTVTTAHAVYTLRKRDAIIPTISNIKANEMKRVVTMIVVMQTVFLVLILPRDIFLVAFSFSWLDGDGISYSKGAIHVNEFLKLFQTANCCANIFIYSKLHDHFRKVVIPGPKKSIAYFLSEMNGRSKKRHRNKPTIELLGQSNLADTENNLMNGQHHYLLADGQYTRRILSIIYTLDESDV